ncbi:hypothetical protein FRB94_009249 [Tulasnella sp. JGI-2019a]|nr:hypothetical protein FRB94_009249 [Tulasnella sp. JGI-2019a]KAG9016506.1 hypothetical protein FRB93_010755 [Tulasnella sp. JGI-2019a]
MPASEREARSFWSSCIRSARHPAATVVTSNSTAVALGYDTIVKISQVKVDEKDRPLQPVTVTHCGELELRKVAAKPPAPLAPVRSRSLSSTGSDHDRKKRRRHSDSRSGSDEGEDREERGESQKRRSSSKKDKSSKSKHKEKHKSSKSKRREASASPIPMDDAPHEETLDELDARLEREENERLEEEKKRQLENIKMRKPIVEASGGVTYKGRGRMKYKDPETKLSGW